MALPWMKFYARDWRGDQALRAVSISARGMWIEMLCIMHEADQRGHLLLNGKPVSDETLSRMTGATVPEVKAYISELEDAGVFSRTRRGIIYSRRMVKDSKASEKGKESASKRWSQDIEKVEENSEPNGVPNGVPTPNPHAKKPEARSQKKKNSQSDRSETGPPDRLFDEPSASPEKPADLWLERIWSSREIYPHPTHKGGKALTLKKLSKLSQSERTEFESWCRDYRAMLDLTDWLSPAMLVTVLNQGRWREPIDLDAARAEARRRGGPGDQPAESKDFGKY